MMEQVNNPLFFRAVFVDATTRQGMSGITVNVSFYRFEKSTGTVTALTIGGSSISELGSSGVYWVTLAQSQVTVEGDYLAVFTTTAAAFSRVDVDQVTVGRGVKYLGTKNFDELQGVPPKNPSFEQAVMLQYQSQRNKVVTSATELKIYNDAGDVVTKSTLTDNGSTMERSKLGNP